MNPTALILLLSAIGQVLCDCGCLKCSKNLRVIPVPGVPCTVILRGPPTPTGCPKPLPYTVQSPLVAPPLPGVPVSYGYKIDGFCLDEHQGGDFGGAIYGVQVQAPVPSLPLAVPITGLKSRPDRIVIAAPETNCQDAEAAMVAPPTPLPFTGLPCNPLLAPPPPPPPLPPVQPSGGPIFEAINLNSLLQCECRQYGHKNDNTPLVKGGIDLVVGLLPHFLRFPIQSTIKALNVHRNVDNRIGGIHEKFHHRRPVIGHNSIGYMPLVRKLEELNGGRGKRSLILGEDNELYMPFLKVTEVDNDNRQSEEQGSDDLEKPFNLDQLVPQDSIFYLLNTPIRFLQQFHHLGEKISPVFKSMPHVLLNSRRYLRDFGKNFKNDVLNFASNLVGDFDDYQPDYPYRQPFRRYRRSLSRPKRYILKVVDEDEVEEFLRSKLLNYFPSTVAPPRKSRDVAKKKKRLVVEKLNSKIIIDNKGRPFVEINGNKRPLFRKNDSRKDESKEDTTDPPPIEDTIDVLIEKAREKIGDRQNQHNNNNNNNNNNLSSQIIRERINKILTEVQHLVNLDLDRYSEIHSNLARLENLRQVLVSDWKKTLVEDKIDDMTSKIRILDDLREMQQLKDRSVKAIAQMLRDDSNFMTKRLIKTLVRLQKLQCVINRVVEDFGEKIKRGTSFEPRKEIRYVDYLSSLHFLDGSKMTLRKERDSALENEMFLLENLRKLAEGHGDNAKLYEEAKVLWEIKNIEKIRKETIVEMNQKISQGQKVRKELRILFDLLRQLEDCEEKQKRLIDDLIGYKDRPRVVSKHYARPKHRTIIDDKKPIRLVTNGYTLTAYKVGDNF